MIVSRNPAFRRRQFVDNAAALDTAVDSSMRTRHARCAIRGFLRAREARPRGFFVGMMISTWSSVHARKPRSWRNRLPAARGTGSIGNPLIVVLPAEGLAQTRGS